MSETAAPTTDFNSFFARLKQAFGLDPVGQQAREADEAIQKRLRTLANTAAYARKQPPDIAIRTLETLSSELEAAHLMVQEANGVGLTGDAATLRGHVAKELEKQPARALDLATRHAATWEGKLGALGPAPTPTPVGGEAATRAKALLAAINEVKSGIEQDEAMLARVNTPPGPVFAGAKALMAILQREYQALVPKRTPGAELQDAPPMKRPSLLGGAEPTDKEKTLETNLGAIETDMANQRAPDTAKLDTAVGIIRESIDCDDAEKAMKRLKTWDSVKTEYRALAKRDPERGKKFIAMMWWYRRQAVDGLMTELQKKYGCTWGSVGSANPESDYDVTVRTHGRNKSGAIVYDYQIVAEFNQTLSARFNSTPPGVLFDTNLYAEAEVEKSWDEDTPVGRDMKAMTEQGQDVGALMKLRRYMDWEDYEDYKQKTVADLPKEQRALTLRQFEEADSLYFISRSRQLEEAGISTKGIPNTTDGLKKLLELAEHLDHDGAKSMDVNNKLYLKSLDEVRELEKQLQATTDPDKKSALLARLRSTQADATFFAAEAYHSEGPLKHVVQAGQSSAVEVNNDDRIPKADKPAAIKAKTEEKLKSYSATQMLQSFNENLGDLLKDLKHYESEPFPGLGFYRSSKYLERMCDAAKWIGSKLPAEAQPEFASLKIGGKAPAAVQAAVGGLVAVRGEKKMFTDVDDPEGEKQAYAVEEMQKIFPEVGTLRDLGRVASAFGQQVNAVARKSITAAMKASDEAPYFQTAAR
jgi:hypothetical protein